MPVTAAKSSPAMGTAETDYAAALRTVAPQINTPERQAALAKMQGAEADVQKSVDAQDKAGQDALAKLDAYKPLDAPKAPVLADAPTQKITDPLQVFGKFMPVMAMLGGLLVKNHAMAAMQAAVSAGDAMQKNDAAALQAAHQAWEDNTKKALDQYQLQRDQYEDAMKSRTEDMNLSNAKLQVLAAMTGNKQMQAALYRGDLDTIDSMFKMQSAAAKQLVDMRHQVSQENIQRQEVALRAKEVAMRGVEVGEHVRHDKAMEGIADERAKLTAAVTGQRLSIAQDRDEQSKAARLTADPQYKGASTTYNSLNLKRAAIDRVIGKIEKGEKLTAGDAQTLIDAHTVLASGRSFAQIGQVKIFENAMPLLDSMAAKLQQTPGGQVLFSKPQAKAIAESYRALSGAVEKTFQDTVLQQRLTMVDQNGDPAYFTPPNFKPLVPNKEAIEAAKQASANGNVRDLLDFKAAYGNDALQKYGIPKPAPQPLLPMGVE